MSTRLEYEVTALREQIMLKWEEKIAEAEAAYRASQDLEGRRDEWRAKAEAALRDLHARLETARDNELESFKVGPCPRNDSYTRPLDRLKQRTEEAIDARDRALGRLDSVKPSKDGTLSLTANMLREWFSL